MLKTICLFISIICTPLVFGRSPAVEPITTLSLKAEPIRPENGHYYYFYQESNRPRFNASKAELTRSVLEGRTPSNWAQSGPTSFDLWTFLVLTLMMLTPLAIRFAVFQQYKVKTTKKDEEMVEAEIIDLQKHQKKNKDKIKKAS
jgi:hypothetical protein